MIPGMNSRQWLHDLSQFPWRNTAAVLGKRFREDRLGLTASSLTFTTIIALVPFFTVALALFTVFPMFAYMRGRLQRWLVESLIPDNIARQVLDYLNQFSSKASGLGIAGLVVLVFTAVALILTIDKTLNNIWRVRTPRPLAQRVLIYWCAITLGPVMLAVSITTTGWAFAAWGGGQGGIALLKTLFDAVEFILVAGALATLYRFVPNTHVKWAHAWAGSLFVAVAIDIAKRGLAFYLSLMPSYSVIYGAFAILPILLIWIYIAWVIVLLGAVIAAYLPSLMTGVARRGNVAGWRFQLALEVLQNLHAAQSTAARGLGGAALVQRLRVDSLQLAPVLETLVAMDWIAPLAEAPGNDDPRFVLLADPDSTSLAPLVGRLLLPPAQSLQPVWQKAPLAELRLRDAL
ncbi:YihY family inner membrane protein [Variovorax sp. dw_954]|uniref:YihY family inner membrane protein n=1 Tax=Variovorax sp. dw_954 TaxID=2720078 RepID=UPI001BD5176F|nr:YihY family inner membrane protein [Variovorax sp. dw_954]